MDNRDLELLQAIQLIIDPLKNDINDMKGDMKDVKDRLGNVEGRLGNVEGRLGNVEDRLGNVESRLGNVEEGTRGTRLIIENSIDPRLQALHEGYMPLVKKVRRVPEEIDSLKERTSMLEFVQKQIVEKIRDNS